MSTTPSYNPDPGKVRPDGCISIIGMAAAGKTTIGRELSALINWPQIDADNVIEAMYGTDLQTLADTMNKEGFLDLERDVISRLNVKRCIISTGGSAVYRPDAILHLKSLGPVIYIAVPLDIILERIARKPDRGLAIGPGQTIEDLFNERVLLYEAAADYVLEGGSRPASHYARMLAAWLSEK